MCVCVSRSSHIIIYMFTAFITTFQYNHIVTVWLVLSLLLNAYVNLLWCASILNMSKGWENDYSPSFNSYIQISTKVQQNASKNIFVQCAHLHIYTLTLDTYNIVQTLNMKHIFVEMQQHKKRDIERHPQKQKPCTLT